MVAGEHVGRAGGVPFVFVWEDDHKDVDRDGDAPATAGAGLRLRPWERASERSKAPSN